MEESKKMGKGQSFWTQKERDVFAADFRTLVRRGKTFSAARCNKYIDEKLKLMYPMFILSFDDKKIRTSIKNCINFMARKRTGGSKIQNKDWVDQGCNAVAQYVRVDGKNCPCLLSDSTVDVRKIQ